MDNNKAYRIVSCGKKSARRDYSKVSGKLELPNLVESRQIHLNGLRNKVSKKYLKKSIQLKTMEKTFA